MVMRYLAVNVVRYVRLGDPVRECSRQPSHYGTQVSQKAPIERRQCASWKSELPGTVVGEEGISVLEEGD